MEEEIVNIKNNLEADISSVRSQYKELSVDFEEALDLVKKSILDRDEIIDLQSQEKEDLISNLESLRNDYLSLKDNIALVNDSKELYSLFEEEREKLERGFEEFSRELLNRLNDTDSDINYIKDMLSSDKNLLLEELDALRSEVDNINNDSRLNELLESKLSLEDSFSGIREELSKFDELEGSLNELRENLLDLESYNDKFDNLNADVYRLSSSVEELRGEIDREAENYNYRFNELSSNMDRLASSSDDLDRMVEELRGEVRELSSGNENIISNIDTISSNFEVLNNNFESVNTNVNDLDNRLSSFREDIDKAINKSLELENNIRDYRKDLEDKIVGIENNINSLSNDSGVKDLFSEELSKLNSLFDNLEKDNKEFRDRLERRVEYFEDTWSDSSRIRSLYSTELREELDSIRYERELEFENYLEGLKVKVDNLSSNVDNYREGDINRLLKELEEAKNSIESYIKDTDSKKEELLSSIMKELESKEESIYAKLEESKNSIESYIKDTDSKKEELLSSMMKELESKEQAIYAKLEDRVRDIESKLSAFDE